MVYVKEVTEEAKMSAAQTAKKIVLETIQRTASETAIENTVSVFNIENDEIKGRIIGREGRNIRTLESLTGVEIIIDDSPDAILISGFDPSTDASNRRFSGLICANFSAIDHVSNVKVGGSLGVYNAGGSPEMFEINEMLYCYDLPLLGSQ